MRLPLALTPSVTHATPGLRPARSVRAVPCCARKYNWREDYTVAAPSESSSWPDTSEDFRSVSPSHSNWRSSWRDELESQDHATTSDYDNWNGAHSNGNGYHHEENSDYNQYQEAYNSDFDAYGGNSSYVFETEEMGQGEQYDQHHPFDSEFANSEQAYGYEEEQEANSSGAGEGIEANPLFAANSQFTSVLKEVLARQRELMEAQSAPGSDDEDAGPAAYAMVDRPVAMPYIPQGPPKKAYGPLAEVIVTAIAVSRHNLQQLKLLRNEMEATIEREERQLERLEFALTKAESDEAWAKQLEKRFNEAQRSGSF